MLEARRLLSAVTSSKFEPDFQPGNPTQSLVFDFDTNVSGSLAAADFDLYDLSRSQPVSASRTSLSFDTTTHRVTLDLSQVNYPAQWGTRTGLLADGNYEAILADTAVSPNLAGDHSLPFHFYQADFNGDRVVNLDDQTILSAYFGTAQPYSRGDIDYSGAVNLDDFTILGNKFGSTLKAPLTAAYGIQVDAQTTESLTISWTAPQWVEGQPDGYRLWRSEDGINFTQLAGVEIAHDPEAKAFSYTDNDVVDGKKYWYRARAFTDAEGNHSSTAKVWGVTTLKPPTDVTTSIESNGDITVRWNPGSEQAEGYIVRLYAQGASESLVEVSSHTITNPAQRSLTIQNPGPGPYFGTVESTKGSLSISSASSAPTEAQRDPSGPWTAALNDSGPANAVSVTWDPEETPYGDDEVTIDISGLARHKFVNVALWTRVDSPSPISPGIEFNVQAGGGSFQLVGGQIFSNPNQQFFPITRHSRLKRHRSRSGSTPKG